ncbi:MAG: pyridoxal phosphate-dependent aminotransferase [Cytophagales bacterium]|nr:MAG: pyridoxal phosphate-dependent aminotransferase [Cytophagales bacterium]
MHLPLSEKVENLSQAISIKYNNIVYELKEKGEKIITLSLGEAFFDIPLFPLDKLPLDKIYHYTHSKGLLELRKKIAEYYQHHFKVTANAEKEVLITAGSKAAIYFCLLAIVEPQSEVIIHEPAWVSYTEMVKLCGSNSVLVPYTEKFTDYEKYITPNTRVIILNNPNNPSGKTYTHEELKYLVDLCKKHNLYLLSDEAYSDFTKQKDDFISAGVFEKEWQNVIVCNSISKNFGISGWRIGYVFANEQIIQEILKINQHVITCPPSILQYYLIAYFDDIINITYDQIHALMETREKVSSYMKEIGLEALEGNSTFYFFVSIAPTLLDSEAFCDKLLYEYKVCAVPGIGYGKSCDKFVRISIGTESLESIKEGLKAIKTLIDITSK